MSTPLDELADLIAVRRERLEQDAEELRQLEELHRRMKTGGIGAPGLAKSELSPVPHYLPAPQAAARAGRCLSTIHRWCLNKEVDGQKIGHLKGGRWMVSAELLEKIITGNA